jgi:hypothetical protein
MKHFPVTATRGIRRRLAAANIQGSHRILSDKLIAATRPLFFHLNESKAGESFHAWRFL